MTERVRKPRDENDPLSGELLRIVTDLLILQSHCLRDAQDAHHHNESASAGDLIAVWSILGEAMPWLLEAQVELYALERKTR